MAKKHEIRRFIFPLAVLLIGGFALWQYSARLLDYGLEAEAARVGHQSDGFRISPQPLEALVWRRLGLGRGAAWGSPLFLSRERGVPHVVEKAA